MHILRDGFTLAEVLLTLLIVGVISSIVIPGIIADTQQAEYKAKWKKDFADLNQATIKLVADNGGSLKKIVSANDNNNFRNLYLNYFNYIKSCNVGSLQDCWSSNGPDIVGWDGNPDNSGIVLNNGAFILLDYSFDNCDGSNDGVNNICGHISVDINGNKTPNKIGKDIFAVYVMENRLIPLGRNNAYSCTTNGGVGCSTKFLYQ
jgi:prepilin-type N-terminal cleavage/methylation domain-containing protein